MTNKIATLLAAASLAHLAAAADLTDDPNLSTIGCATRDRF